MRRCYLGLALLLLAASQSVAGAQEPATLRSVMDSICAHRPLPAEWFKHSLELLKGIPGADTPPVPPARLYSAPLSYPPQAQAEGFEAVVMLRAIAEVDGRISHAEVLDANVSQDKWYRMALMERWQRLHDGPMPMSPRVARRLFEREALMMLYQSRFEPGQWNGEPIRTVICIPVNFKLP